MSGDNAILDFQPAAGVEVMIMSQGFDANSGGVGQLYNGTIDCNFISANANANTGFHTANMKMFINNTNYLRILALGAGVVSTYSGVTTK